MHFNQIVAARSALRDALAEVIPYDPQDARIDEVLACIEDLIDEKLQQLETRLSK